MVTALILSGGTGTRLGTKIPKQYLEVNDKPMIIYCVEQLYKNSNIDKLQIVADEDWQQDILGWLEEYGVIDKFAGFSQPGETRQLSIFNGIKDIRTYSDENDYVFIHDAARPNLSQEMIDGCIAAMKGYDGVLPVLPMKDTVYLSEDGKSVTSLLNRQQVFAGQAPEVFRLGTYYDANVRLINYTDNDEINGVSPDSPIMKINGSTEPAIMAGLKVAMIPGDENNFKITTTTDLERFMRNEGMDA